MQTWIFQGNPKIYNVAHAVRSLREDTWLVQQHKNEIRPGDRVYIWESGPDGGIVAVGEVLDEVSERVLPDESKPYVSDDIKLGGVQPRVLIRVTRVCDPKLKRTVILENPHLSNLLILRQPQGTNFPVTPAEAAIIEELLGK
jgi:5-methylcytosine-specific restriction enzyme B